MTDREHFEAFWNSPDPTEREYIDLLRYIMSMFLIDREDASDMLSIYWRMKPAQRSAITNWREHFKTQHNIHLNI
jgi:hypothetical protein